MAEFEGELEQALKVFRTRRPDGAIFASDFFPGPDDDEGIRLIEPMPQPPAPEWKTFDSLGEPPPSDEAWELAGRVGDFAFAAMARTDQEVVVA